jgi:phage gp46-like protein
MSWQIDPNSGDYIMTNGAPVDDPNLIYPAYYRLKINRLQWLYAPDTKYGSDFYKVKKNITTKPQTSLETIAARALQPIVDSGRATNINVTVTGVARSGVALECDIGSGQTQSDILNLTGLGVT